MTDTGRPEEMPTSVWLSPVDAELFASRQGRAETQFIRADLVCGALEHARESIQIWANLISDATQTRIDASDDLAKIDTVLNLLPAPGGSDE